MFSALAKLASTLVAEYKAHTALHDLKIKWSPLIRDAGPTEVDGVQKGYDSEVEICNFSNAKEKQKSINIFKTLLGDPTVLHKRELLRIFTSAVKLGEDDCIQVRRL